MKNSLCKKMVKTQIRLKKPKNIKQDNMCHKQIETNFPDLTKEFGKINKDKKKNLKPQ